MSQSLVNCLEPLQGSTEQALNMPGNCQEGFALSYMQESLWIIEQLAPGTSAYNLPEGWRCRGRLDLGALQGSLTAVSDRHESLRTVFGVRDGKPMQIIQAPHSFDLEITDLSKASDPMAEAQRRLQAEACRPFDLVRGPLFRAHLYRLAEDDHILLFNLHHLVADEWSFNILRRELGEVYAGLISGGELRLPELPIQYVDFAAWQRDRMTKGLLNEAFEFWKQKLRGPLPSLDLPGDYARPSRQSFRGATQYHKLSSQLSDALKELGRREGATLFMVLLAGFETLLHRYTRQTDIIVGSPIAGREQAETEGLIGFLVNTHALRCDAGDDPPFIEFLRRVRETTLEAKAHQEVSLDRILEALQPPRDAGRHPLFQVVFGLQGGLPESWSLPEVLAERIEVDNGGAKFDWTLLASETRDGIRLRSEYRTDLFDAGTITRFVRHLETMLEAAIAQPGQNLSKLPLLTEPERCQLVSAWNPASTESVPGPCLHEWFATQVERTPNGIAVTDEHHQLSYRELNARANRLAHLLQGLGVGPGAAVAICLERSVELVVACLAVLKAGGAYVPVDPCVPAARMAFIIDDTQARVLLTQRTLVPELEQAIALGQIRPKVVALDANRDRIDAEPPTNPVSTVTPKDTAYIIYTSGSTGQPKGVLVTHFNVVRLMQQTQPWFRFDSADVWTLFHSYSFDFSVWELWGALLYGGRLVVVPYLVSRSPKEFLALLVREGVTVLNQTPSAFRQLIWVDAEATEAPKLNLRYVVFGGEALELQSLKPWFDRHGDAKPLLVNMYGITETTVHVTYRQIRQSDLAQRAGSVIGVPIPDLRLYLLDQHLQPVPLGVPGEICVGGAGVARGYLNRPELTAERFVPDPWSSQPGARLYRSGDLARYTSSGELEYLGRMDHQVKIRGFRVELGEIESALNRQEGIRESAVIADELNGERRLVAYVVPVKELPPLPELRQHLARSLPDYMIPAVYIPLASLPLTPNGKLDRRGLPCPRNTDLVRTARSVPPRNDVEKRIAETWCEILNHKSVGVEDNFFHLGGHSLLASQVMARLTDAFNFDLPVRLLFETPTIAGLAESVARIQREEPRRPVAIPRRLQSGRAQELLARLDELTEEEIDELLSGPEHQKITT